MTAMSTSEDQPKKRRTYIYVGKCILGQIKSCPCTRLTCKLFYASEKRVSKYQTWKSILESEFGLSTKAKELFVCKCHFKKDDMKAVIDYELTESAVPTKFVDVPLPPPRSDHDETTKS